MEKGNKTYHYNNLSIEDIEGEVWNPVVDGLVYASNLGRIKKKRLRTSKKFYISKQIMSNTLQCSFSILKTKSVARMVLLAFSGNPPNIKSIAVRKNGDLLDNTIDNLFWGSSSDAAYLKFANGKQKGLSGSLNPMYRGAKLNANCLHCGKEFTYFKSSSSGKYCCKKCYFETEEFKIAIRKVADGNKGREFSESMRLAVSARFKGKKRSAESLLKSKETFKRNFLKKPKNRHKHDVHRKSMSYKKWRADVFNKCGDKCSICNSVEKLHAHHIIPYKFVFMEYELIGDDSLINSIDNGIVLCSVCHKKEHPECFRKCIECDLMDALLLNFEQNNKGFLDFKEYYKHEMEVIIDHYKKKLD